MSDTYYHINGIYYCKVNYVVVLAIFIRWIIALILIDRKFLINWLNSLRYEEVPETIIHVLYKQYGRDTDKDETTEVKEVENDKK